MKNKTSIFSNPESNERLDLLKIKGEKLSEFVWQRTKTGRYVGEPCRRRGEMFSVSSARTLEELLALLPEDRFSSKKLEFIGDVWECSFYTREKIVMKHKDPKQAVTAMIEWAVENGYIEVGE